MDNVKIKFYRARIGIFLPDISFLLDISFHKETKEERSDNVMEDHKGP